MMFSQSRNQAGNPVTIIPHETDATGNAWNAYNWVFKGDNLFVTERTRVAVF